MGSFLTRAIPGTSPSVLSVLAVFGAPQLSCHMAFLSLLLKFLLHFILCSVCVCVSVQALTHAGMYMSC